MKSVLSFWLDLGVDGWRMDAIGHIWEDEQFLDEPISGFAFDPNDYIYLTHIYTYDLPMTRTILKEFYDLIKSYTAIDGFDRLDMLEFYQNTNVLDYNQGSIPYFDCSDFPFNFNLLFSVPENETVSAQRIQDLITSWLRIVPDGKKANWVIGNHDQWRVGSRFRSELMNAFNLLTMTLPGVSITYYGEELGKISCQIRKITTANFRNLLYCLGMTNTDISWEDTVDPSGCNCGIDHYTDQLCSRDPERTPMQWNNEDPNAGFSTAEKTWLPVNPNYKTVNAMSELADPYSHVNFMKTVLMAKNSDPAFDVGALKISNQNNVLAYSRSVNPDFYTVFVVLINFDTKSTTVDFGGEFSDSKDTGFVLVSTLGDQSQFPAG